MIRYEVTGTASGKLTRKEFDNAQAAQDFAEELGEASVVRFHGTRNSPDRLPEIVWSSCGLWSYRERGWREHYIYDGYGNPISTRGPVECV